MLPQFRRGNIVLGKNLPRNIDFAYCRKVLTNIKGKEYENTPSGKGALLVGISNIVNCIRPHGWICIVEYDKEFKLGQYLERGGLRLIKQTQIKRREIRSRGRTPVISDLAVYQCQKHV
jgi:hypothetical protein